MKAPSTLFLSALGLSSIILACGPPMPQPGMPAHAPAVPTQLASHGTVIPVDGGEHRTRRFPGASSEFTIKIDSANLERVLSSRDGTFMVNRIRGSLGFNPI